MNQLINKQSKVMTMIKALLASYIITGIILLLLALLMYKLEPPSGVISVGIVFAYIFSCFIGGFILGKNTKEKRFLWGIIVGCLYFILILFISMMMGKEVFGQIGSTITVFIMCSLGGMLGGMIS
jgi:putative membrane protein, TIGR04086 family/integral membrane protein, TIGR04097 family